MDTIFALSTAPGRAGVAIIRISGTQAGSALSALDVALPKPRMATLVTLHHPDTKDPIDTVLVLRFVAPESFTGEDCVELHCHGSRAVIAELLEVLHVLPGLRPAEAGEFARRAFLNGKLDLTRAEGLADLIDAETKAQKKQALRQLSGELERLYENWRSRLVTMLARMEAYIDFPDEDIPEEINHAIEHDVNSLIHMIEAHISDRSGEILRDGAYCAILGAPNAGKSSLINALTKRDIAIVSDIPGTTRDALEVHLDVAGYPLTLCDTAGLRESTEAIESEGIKRALARAEQADFTLIMFDAGKKPDKKSLALIDKNSLVVLNKIDQEHISNHKELKEKNAISLSVKTGKGMDALLASLETLLKDHLAPGEGAVFTRARHRQILTNCSAQLVRFLDARKTGKPIELAAEELRLAARHLGSITGHIDVEELLDNIFSSFCIGK